MACECTRCRQLGRALASADAALRRPGALPAAGALAAVLVLAVTLVAGVPFAVALLLALAVAGGLVGGVLLLRPRLDDDGLAPLAVERWLCENDDDWPWWVLGGVTAFVGLLLLTSPGFALPLLLTGGLVAAVPKVRRVLRGCARLA